MEGDVVVRGCHWRFTVGQILPRLIPKFNKNTSPLSHFPLPAGIQVKGGACDNGLTFPTDPSGRLRPPRCPGREVPVHEPTVGLEIKETLKNDSFSW